MLQVKAIESNISICEICMKCKITRNKMINIKVNMAILCEEHLTIETGKYENIMASIDDYVINEMNGKKCEQIFIY